MAEAISAGRSFSRSLGARRKWRKAFQSVAASGRPGRFVMRAGVTVASESVIPSRDLAAAWGHFAST
jgi:hypothetical protein